MREFVTGTISFVENALQSLGQRGMARALQWWHTVFISAQLLVLACSRRSWQTPQSRMAFAQQTLSAAVLGINGFAVIVLFAAAVVTRIVYVTANSYGLSSYAIEMLVRVLVIELIPMSAALFVALRYSVTRGSNVFRMRSKGRFAELKAQGLDPSAIEVLPSAVAGVLAVLMLSALASIITMALAYFMIYGISPYGFEPYTRGVGKVFSPTVSLVFLVKTILFSLAVGLSPVATALQNLNTDSSRVGVALELLIRMMGMLLVVELLSLAANYS